MHQSFDHIDAVPPDAQALSFAYGQAACTSWHRPQRRIFKELALERGWTEEQFEQWALQRRWWVNGVLLEVPERTITEIVKERIRMNVLNGAPKNGYTCDTCGAMLTCVFVFDGYNTNGDCLAEK